MKKAEYKYQKYNEGYYAAEALMATYNASRKDIASKNYTNTDISFCTAFEKIVMHIYRDFKDKSGVWNYILFNEFCDNKKSCTKKRRELEFVGFPLSRASYYREKTLFTNLVAEYFALGNNYVQYKCDAESESIPCPNEIKNYVIKLTEEKNV